jgi:hypothetical protein
MKNPFSGLFRARDKPQDSVSAAPTFYFGTSGSGKAVNAQTAIQLSTVYACVRVISETVASLPLGVYEGEQKNKALVALYATRAGDKRSVINQFLQYCFLCGCMDRIHPANPCHLICGFQVFGDAFCLCHLRDHMIQTFLTGFINLMKVFQQGSIQDHSCVQAGPVLFQILPAHSPILPERLLFLLGQAKVWNQVVSALNVLSAVFFKNGFHFRPSLWYDMPIKAL